MLPKVELQQNEPKETLCFQSILIDGWVKKQFDAARCCQATRDEAVAIVKKAVATIKSEGPDKAYAEIDDPEGPFADPGGTTETGNSASAIQFCKRCSNRGSVQRKPLTKEGRSETRSGPRNRAASCGGTGGLAATAGDNRR